MERKQLTKEIINNDLKQLQKNDLFYGIISIIIICCSTYEIFIKTSDSLIGFPIFGMIFGIICFITFIKKIVVLKQKYTIIEGQVEKVFYEQNRNIYKLSIRGMKGLIITSNIFSANENVYVVCYKNRVLMCYNMSMYYL